MDSFSHKPTSPKTPLRFEGVLLASDYDGTAFGSITGLPKRNVEAVEYFIQQGGLFTIATGRTYVTYAPHVHKIPVNAPCILSNGATIYDFQENRMLKEQCLPQTAQEDLIQLCKEMPSLGFEAYFEEKIFAYQPNHITDTHMEIVGQEYQESSIEKMPCPWTKVLIQQERDLLHQAKERIEQIRPNTYEAIFSNPRYLELTAKGVSKGSAVLELARSYNIKHIYCVGDNENDLSMLKIADIAFAPSTSAEVVLATNPHVLCSCEEGVLGALIDYLDQNLPNGGSKT